jgi:DNA (cytosine-5)-methyltransferase 1
MNYYNENDPKSAAWLRELIKAGLIPDGFVDERSITEVTPGDLSGYTQCHFFAGVAGWSFALQLAAWPSTRPVGTGSCPCQPFSTAGKGLGDKDERHLWPVFFRLIRDCRNLGQPWAFTVFGEQVASAIGKGWLDGISADLEAENYACGSVVLGAHSVGAPHIRQRLYWVAHADVGRLKQRDEEIRSVSELNESGADGRLGNAIKQGLEGHTRHGDNGSEPRRLIENATRSTSETGHANHWNDFALVHCRDGKTRRIPTEPAFQPLANGIPARVVRLRGYGNAIVPQVAAEFIKAFMTHKFENIMDKVTGRE